jgi:hypothetical protein
VDGIRFPSCTDRIRAEISNVAMDQFQCRGYVLRITTAVGRFRLAVVDSTGDPKDLTVVSVRDLRTVRMDVQTDAAAEMVERFLCQVLQAMDTRTRLMVDSAFKVEH